MKNKVVINKKNGFTLIELLISIAILGIVLSMIYSIDIFGTKMSAKSTVTSQNQYDVRMASDFITKQLRYAKSVKIINNPTPEVSKNCIYIKISSGKAEILYYKGITKVTIPGVSDVTDYKLTFSKESDKVINFTVGKSGTTTYDIISKVTVLNADSSSPITINSSDNAGVIFEISASLSDADAVAADKIWLDIPNKDSVQNNVSLPISGPNGTTITWSSDKPSIVTSTGSVTQPIGSDETVILTATIKKGSVSDTKAITLIVKKVGTVATIVSIDDINDTAYLNAYTMPSKVKATMSDNTKIDVQPINWLGSIDASSPGIKTCKGSVTYDGKNFDVNLVVTVTDKIVISNITDIDVTRKNSFSRTFIVNGGTSPYNFEYTIPSESTWITGSGYKLSGTAPNSWDVSYTIKVKVNDSAGNSETFDLVIHVIKQ